MIDHPDVTGPGSYRAKLQEHRQARARERGHPMTNEPPLVGGRNLVRIPRNADSAIFRIWAEDENPEALDMAIHPPGCTLTDLGTQDGRRRASVVLAQPPEGWTRDRYRIIVSATDEHGLTDTHNLLVIVEPETPS